MFSMVLGETEVGFGLGVLENLWEKWRSFIDGGQKWGTATESIFGDPTYNPYDPATSDGLGLLFSKGNFFNTSAPFILLSYLLGSAATSYGKVLFLPNRIIEFASGKSKFFVIASGNF